MSQEGSSLSMGSVGIRKCILPISFSACIPVCHQFGGEVADYIRLCGGFLDSITVSSSKQMFSSRVMYTHDYVLLIRKVGVFYHFTPLLFLCKC